ncbi:hypothetical protein [Fredinandcohnia sp. 179-A 10B2 NHS]|uniref:hypothetical protein n=1 Tax=Fredinandcohnia sp. 179-A 10B2 NHS TaxID=3235176 RepID=UPI0039A2D5F3
MAFVVTIALLALAVFIGYKLTAAKTKKRKRIVWGVITMLVFSPLVSWLVSIAYATIVESGWAGIALMMLLLPLIFLIGLVILLIGIFKKE